MKKVRRKDALDYHTAGRPGKIQVVATKPLTSQRDLSLAYSPGVAEPCLAIAEDPSLAHRYTARGNLVAVITNGTAVLGLGNIGPLAAKPVMEGKGVLFKKFADIDVFDLELDASDPDRFVECVAALEPTFGGINLEDIKAPESFYIEEKLRARMKIPVFHDDQHGTAIISGAALINAALLQGKALGELRVVVSGAGASAIACARFFVALGVDHGKILMADSRGVLHDGRDDLTPVKREFAQRTTARKLADALVGADVFLGLSKGGVVTPEMIEPMAPRPIIFALANPDPEIGYDEAKLARPDAIVATGRSDYDNQVNNVLGFPFVFRGALDVRATTISEPMKIAAAQALADLARRDVPQEVSRAYGTEFHFGPSYIIPKPFDPRVLYWVAPAVARAAVESGAATGPFDERAYVEHLRGLLGHSTAVLRKFVRRAATDPRRVVFPEADDPRILEACSILLDEKVARPVLLGSRELIEGVVRSREIDIDLGRCEIVDPATDPALADYATSLYEMRQRKGMGRRAAMKLLRDRNYFGLMMVKHGRADAVVTGLLAPYAETIRPMLQIIGLAPGIRRAAGMYLMLHRQRGILCFGDTTVNLHSDAETLADVAELVADAASTFELEPRVAMLSMSNFGSVRHAEAAKVARAVELLRSRRPDLEVEGELQGNLAVDYALQQRTFPFSRMSGPANVLVFPNLDAGNVAYKLVRELGGVTTVGPVLLGMARAVTVLERDCEVDNIVLMTALTVVEAQELDRRRIAAE
ncbi:MAG: NADP-dependent malic enzyme [Nannocystaceae bacterium]|nr:NADP-dependent malic enzyme [Deltaproteobacteria bacterium]MBP7286960.1 NADP-dependent malic enzyme [Nannocystaceae bacterium]